jgi:hypothetical protein
MKIIVCVSGAIPNNDGFETLTSVEENIMTMKSILPDADYAFTTWEDQPYNAFTNRRYKTPPMTYNPGKKQILHDIKLLRELRKKDPSAIKKLKEYAEDNLNTENEIMRQMEDNVTKRTWFRKQQKQLIIHAMTCRDFVKPEHDVVIRMRYDTLLDEGFLKRWVYELAELCYRERRPIGFHRYPRTGSQIYSKQPIMEFSHQGNSVDSSLCRDFLLMHRADMIDYNILMNLYDTKRLQFSEPAWYQLLCEAYGTHAIIINLPITLSKLGWFEEQEKNKESDKFLSELISQTYPALSV